MQIQLPKAQNTLAKKPSNNTPIKTHMMNLLKQPIMILKKETLPSQETGASSQHSFLESLHLPRLHSQTQIVSKHINDYEERERERERERLRVGMSSSEKRDDGEKIAISIC